MRCASRSRNSTTSSPSVKPSRRHSVKQISDLHDALAGLTEQRDTAAKTLADTTATIERETAEATAAQNDIDDAKQAAAAIEAQTAAKAAAAQEAADTAKQTITALGQQIAETTAAARTEADAAKQKLDRSRPAECGSRPADRKSVRGRAEETREAEQQKLAVLDQQIAARTAAAQTESDATQQKLDALNQEIADRTTVARQEQDAAKQTATALSQQIADATARLSGLERDATQLRADTARTSAIETQLSAARDALNAAVQQRSEVEKAIADDSVLRDRIASEVTEARAALAQTTGALADLQAQLKIEADVANAPRPVNPLPPGRDEGQPAMP